MTQFVYKALTPAGEQLEGQMDAANREDVIKKIQAAGNIPLTAKELNSGFSLENLFSSRKVINQKQVGEFTDQLATLLNSGMPLERSLSVMIDLIIDDKLRIMVEQVRDKVRGGGTLSDALEDQHVFTSMYTNMVRAGELGGTLEVTLERLAEYMTRAKELKDSVISAMIYPTILFVLAGVSMFVLLGKVVPSFKPMFEDAGIELPNITKLVLAIAAFVQSYWWVMILLFIVIIVVIKQKLKEADFRLAWDKKILKLPLIGDLATKIDIARFTRTLGTLVDSGVPLLSGLNIAKKVVNNTLLHQTISDASEKVKHGEPLAAGLDGAEEFPRLAQQLISVGEETGKLNEMLLKTAGTYDVEVKTSIDRMISLLVPVVVLVLAALIFFIIFAIMMAMLKMNDIVG
ncbi:MAG: type II secretion system F family protein [Proteobacteria bacterium]|nr:type II secretion system F family protein [Pseudomonadota bacterium]